MPFELFPTIWYINPHKTIKSFKRLWIWILRVKKNQIKRMMIVDEFKIILTFWFAYIFGDRHAREVEKILANGFRNSDNLWRLKPYLKILLRNILTSTKEITFVSSCFEQMTNADQIQDLDNVLMSFNKALNRIQAENKSCHRSYRWKLEVYRKH